MILFFFSMINGKLYESLAFVNSRIKILKRDWTDREWDHNDLYTIEYYSNIYYSKS